jgi:hypothetical protein
MLNFATLAAQVLYGLCNWDCMKKFDFSINRLKDEKLDQMNILGENLRVLSIQHVEEELKIININTTMNERWI